MFLSSWSTHDAGASVALLIYRAVFIDRAGIQTAGPAPLPEIITDFHPNHLFAIPQPGQKKVEKG
jgi:hypothetical protein